MTKQKIDWKKAKKDLAVKFESIVEEESQRRLNWVFDFIFSKIVEFECKKKTLDISKENVYNIVREKGNAYSYDNNRTSS